MFSSTSAQSGAPLAAPAVQGAPAAAVSTAPAAASGANNNNNFISKVKRAFDEGRLNDQLVEEIKKRFASPLTIESTVAAAASATTAQPLGGGFGTTVNQAVNASMAVAPSTARLLPGASALQGGVGKEAQASSQRAEQSRKAKEFLYLLLACDSGFNNSEELASSADVKEAVEGLHATIGSVANSAASDIVAYLKKELSATALGGESVMTVLQGYQNAQSPTGVVDKSAKALLHVGSNPIILAAQCLYLLSRHFQMQAVFVKDALEVVETLLDHIRVELSGRAVQFGAFRDAPETAAVCTLTWLVCFSVVNAVAPWKKVRGGNGDLGPNSLIRSDVATTLHNVIVSLRKKYMTSPAQADEPFNYLPSTLSARGPDGALFGKSAAMLKSAGGYGTQTQRWLAVVDGFLSILTLAEGCSLRAKGDDKGYDRALEAFLGDRDTNKASMQRGKVTKRMVQLAPSPATLSIPIESIYIAPYEILSFLFDDMLPLLRHIADLEVASYRRYLDHVQLLEELPRTIDQGAGGTFNTVGLLSGYGPNPVTSQENGLGMPAAKGARASPEPFTSEMAHILESLVVCLQYLPPEVLNPDLGIDCAATFFMFRNCVRHMAQVFKVQRGTTALWETFTLKLVTRFLEVLAMTGRNPQYVERVVAMLTNAQLELQEMQWSGLVSQALECAGFSSSPGNALANLPRESRISDVFQQDNYSNVANAHSLHRQFTREYARKYQQRYVSSFFMLLRQVISHPVLRKVNEFVSLELALSFLFAPQLSQSMLGSILALISTLITNAKEATTVWEFLEHHKLLQPTPFAISSSANANNKHGDDTASRSKSGMSESRSLLGHCQLECTKGVYSITIGFLNLVIALFRYDVPTMGRFSTYSSIAHFIAHDIFKGVSRRSFALEQERHTVIALSAAALRQALLVQMVSDGTTATIPFATIMATSKSPTDVTGEALKIILQASTTPHELVTPQRTAVRQCLHLLVTAIEVTTEQKLEIFSFDSRITQSASFAYHVLFVCGIADPMLQKAALQLLLQFPRQVMNQASAMWYAEQDRLGGILSMFAQLLRSNTSFVGGIIRAPPELAILDADPNDSCNNSSASQLADDNRSLLLDLLIRHAPNAEPSATSWMCGFYTPTVGTHVITKVQDTRILNSIVEGGSSVALGVSHPVHAVKYVKLLYLLRSNKLYGSSVVRSFMESGCQALFLSLQQFRPEECSPLLLSKYAYVMKLLALEACTIYSTSPAHLDVESAAIPSISVEVLLSLLHPQRRTDDWISSVTNNGDATAHSTVLARGASADITQWLVQVLNSMPAFPVCSPPPTASPALAPAKDEIVQYNVSSLYESFQKEQQQMNLPPLTTEQLREKLMPFVEANHCFLVYSSAATFIEGWCQLVNISCCVVKGLSNNRMREFCLAMLKGVESTRTMTLAAQEQVAYHLFNSLTTVITRLQRKCEEEIATAEQAETQQLIGTTGNDISGQRPTLLMNNEVSTNRTGIIDEQKSQTVALRGTRPSAVRRTREETVPSQPPGIFSTSAGNRSNMLSASQLSRRLRCTVVAQPNNNEFSSFAAASANQALLRPLLLSIATWGARIPVVRGDMYMSLLSLALIPDVSLDDALIFRSQDVLFELLSVDICNASSGVRRRHALTLLVYLIQASPALCEAFCTASDGSENGLGPLPSRCGKALLDSVNATVSQFFSEGGDIRSVFWLLRSTFDFLCAISKNHASHVLQSHMVSTCLLMDCWTRSTQIIFGYTTPEFSAGTMLEHNREVLKRLVLGTVRWFNVMHSTVGESVHFVKQMQEFVRVRRQVIEYALGVSYAAPDSVQGRTGPMNAVSLTLYAELTELFRCLSTTYLAEECRTLVGELALPELLEAISSPVFEEACRHHARDALVEASVLTGAGGSNTAQMDAARERQVDLIAIAVRNIAHFLLRSEYGMRGVAHVVDVTEGSTPSIIRGNSRYAACVFTAVANVANAIETASNSTNSLPEVRLENHVFALHALVGLVHSFVLPLDGASTNQEPVTADMSFDKYLRTLPLDTILELLVRCQGAIYSMRNFNADYRTGISGVSTGGTGWAVAAKSISNVIADATGKTTKRITTGPRGASDATAATEPNTPALGPRGTTPSTPLVHPADGNNLMGTVQSGPAKDGSAMERNNTLLSATMAPMGVPQQQMHEEDASDPNTTIGQYTNLQVGMTRSRAAAVQILPSATTADVTLADTDERLRAGAISWDDVLSIENSVRQIKIAIANAIRAVRAASETVRKM